MACRYTIEDRKKIEEYLKKGYRFALISRLMGRGHSGNGIRTEVEKFGSHFNYNAEEAQKSYEDRIKKGTLKKQQIECKTQSTMQLNPEIEERIHNIEMQIEILSETIKELLIK